MPPSLFGFRGCLDVSSLWTLPLSAPGSPGLGWQTCDAMNASQKRDTGTVVVVHLSLLTLTRVTGVCWLAQLVCGPGTSTWVFLHV